MLEEDINAFLADLGQRGLSGVFRRRKLVAIRELYRFLARTDTVVESLVEGVNTPSGRSGGGVT